MARGAPGEVADLLAARDPGRGDDDVGRLVAQRREQPQIADRPRDLVVLGLEAERPGHAAAARVELDDLGPRDPLEQRAGRLGADARLLVAVAVEDDPP